MSQTKETWTPGPWMLTQDDRQALNGEWGIESADGAWQVCHIAGYAGANNLPDHMESDANARLIAAAPTLYAVTQEYLAHCKCSLMKLCERCKAARAALALVNKPE